MGAIHLWSEGQQAMSALGRTLDEADGERPVPACPTWTVREVYAHQAGATTDLLNGQLDGAGSDPWTAKQVADRADLSLPAILNEWDAGAPNLVTALEPLGDEGLDPRLVMDLWHHHQDVRGALGLPGETTGPVTEWVFSQSHRLLRHLVRDAGLDVVLGTPPAEPTPGMLTVEPFEGARGVLGRRSPDQIRAWSWGIDDPEPLVATIPVFGPRTEPLVEVAE
jgi:uncharacterized protein (TIGR03083 family)